MKKGELKDIIKRKKILKESLEIVNEVGGFDSKDLQKQFHGNYYDDLANIFFQIDELILPTLENVNKIMDDEDYNKGAEVLQNFGTFMMSFHNFLTDIKNKTIEDKYLKKGQKFRPSLGLSDEELNESL